MTLDIAELKAWTGRQEVREDVVTPVPVAALAATLDRDDPAPAPGTPLPPLWHWLYFLPLHRQSELGPDGHARRGGFLPPVPLPRRMWAGGQIETLADLRVGDRVTRTETVRDVAFKAGRSGRLAFVTVDHAVATERGVAIRERQDIVYREAANAQTGTAAAPERDDPSAYEAVWDVPATPTLLFRYSAMTFNGHRFHYDQPYATQVEGYADLVVHGPMQASLLLNLAATLLGSVPPTFSYRGVSPMTANQTFRVCGRLTEAGFEGVTLDAADRVCMRERTTIG